MKINTAISEEDVALFLYCFHLQKKNHGMVVYDRKKNLEAMLALEISALERESIIDELTPSHYYKGPRRDTVNIGAEVWEFGHKVKDQDVYIKVSLGVIKGPVLCLSFHRAERKIKYPFRF